MRNTSIPFRFQWLPLFLLILSCSGMPAGKESNSSAEASAPAAGADMYYEYSITHQTKSGLRKSYLKLYLSASGNARTEMEMPSPANLGKTNRVMVIIGHPDKPNESITLDDEKKTYTINHFDLDSLRLPGKMQSVATKIGTDKILGYTCVHARIISNRNIGNFYKSIDTMDLWKSNDIPVQEHFRKLMNKFESMNGSSMYSPEIAAQLKQMGCDGFMMKMQIHEKDYSLNDELLKADHRDLSDAIFRIPAGYTELKEGF